MQSCLAFQYTHVCSSSIIRTMVYADHFEEDNQIISHSNTEESQLKLVARGHWRPAEDNKLREIVALYGPQNWNLIADKLGAGRSGKSCRLRWFNQLDPRINRRAFTEDEEERLLVAHRLYGSKWAMIAATLFPGRTDNAVKNHWHVVMARKYRGHNRNTNSRVRKTGLDTARKVQGPVFNHNNESSSCSFPSSDETTVAPQFIDFLGVGAL